MCSVDWFILRRVISRLKGRGWTSPSSCIILSFLVTFPFPFESTLSGNKGGGGTGIANYNHKSENLTFILGVTNNNLLTGAFASVLAFDCVGGMFTFTSLGRDCLFFRGGMARMVEFKESPPFA